MAVPEDWWGSQATDGGNRNHALQHYNLVPS
jgi:hypothetical protein